MRAELEPMPQAGDDEQLVRFAAAFHDIISEAAGVATMAALLSGNSSRTPRPGSGA